MWNFYLSKPCGVFKNLEDEKNTESEDIYTLWPQSE